jgi:GntR family transcriptional regulator / MocR family aminotransferase
VLFPALRLGYLIAPPSLVDAFIDMRRAAHGILPRLEQEVLTDFIKEGHFARHIRRMRTLYAERRAALIEALSGLPLELGPAHTGLHLAGWLPDGVNDQAAAAMAASRQVDVLPISRFAIEPVAPGGLAMGYGTLNRQQIEEGVRRLADAFRNMGIGHSIAYSTGAL